MARGTNSALPAVRFVVAAAPNSFDMGPFAMSLNAPTAPGPDGFCRTVAVQTNASNSADGSTTAPVCFDFYGECAKAGALKPLHLAKAVVKCKPSHRRTYCCTFLGSLLPGGALTKLADAPASPKPSTFVVVDTHQETAAADFVEVCRGMCTCELVFIGRAQAKDWGPLIGFSKQPATADGATGQATEANKNADE